MRKRASVIYLSSVTTSSVTKGGEWACTYKKRGSLALAVGI